MLNFAAVPAEKSSVPNGQRKKGTVVQRETAPQPVSTTITATPKSSPPELSTKGNTLKKAPKVQEASCPTLTSSKRGRAAKIVGEEATSGQLEPSAIPPVSV